MLAMILGKMGIKGARPGPPLSWLQRVKIAVSAAKGIEFLHEKVDPRIIHNNIKSRHLGNIEFLHEKGVSIHDAHCRVHTIRGPEYYSVREHLAPEYVKEYLHTLRAVLNDMHSATSVMFPSVNLLGSHSEEGVAQRVMSTASGLYCWSF